MKYYRNPDHMNWWFFHSVEETRHAALGKLMKLGLSLNMGRIKLGDTATNTESMPAISEEDVLRAQLYEFLATLLRVEPANEVLAQVAGLNGDDSPIGQASATLAHLARQMDAANIRSEYVDLFIGVGRGELLPYCSYYLTGFLNEKPLASLRQDMAAIGIVRADGVKDPEDHIASLCDMMAGLIRGQFGRPFSLAEQASFFKKHLAPWGGLFFSDLESAKNAVFFAPVGSIGKAFMDIESKAFDMELSG